MLCASGCFHCFGCYSALYDTPIYTLGPEGCVARFALRFLDGSVASVEPPKNNTVPWLAAQLDHADRLIVGAASTAA